MRILHLLASPFFSGPAESLLLLAKAQRALGHEVTIAIDRKRSSAPAEELLLPKVEGLTALPLELSVKSMPWAMWADAKALRRAQVDVLHAHFSHDHTIAWLAGRRVPLVRSIHAARSLTWATPRADAWTVPTDSLARRLLGQPVLVLPPLLDVAFRPSEDRAALRALLGLPAGRLVGMVSTFQPSRRHALGLEALSRLTEAHLVLIGDGALLPAIRSQVEEQGLGKRVTFTGYKRDQDFVSHLQALDEVWVLGLGNDHSARVAAQARACGVRVVAVDEGALPRYADALVPADPEAIAAAALTGERRAVTLETNESIARRVLELYVRGGAPGATP